VAKVCHRFVQSVDEVGVGGGAVHHFSEHGAPPGAVVPLNDVVERAGFVVVRTLAQNKKPSGVKESP
jgi:hypothetical protein